MSALGDRFQISGLDREQSFNLALMLRSGSLPAPVKIIEEKIIGPSLGADNIKMGFYALGLGLSMIFTFMIIYYRTLGIIANLTLLSNLALLIASLALIQATLTLPGIAGIVLTLGMAVDANVLIFERIREEIDQGCSVWSALDRGFDKAANTILDSNVTTMIIGLVLFFLGSGTIKGFAVTLSIGLMTSVITSLIGSKVFINLWYAGQLYPRITFSSWGYRVSMQGFRSYYKKVLIGAACLCSLSLMTIGIYRHNLGLEFTGGVEIEVSFNQPASRELISSLINIPKATVNAFGSSTQFLIKIPLVEDIDQEILEKTLISSFREAGLESRIDRIDRVGSEFSSTIVEQSVLALSMALIAITLYIAIRFEIRLALSALIALMFDPIIIMGMFSYFQWTFDVPALAGLLAVIGYSINDTIVVFDRVRENFQKIEGNSNDVFFASLDQTMGRTLITSLLTLMVVVALLVFGTEILRGFSLALIIGIVVGTASSILVAGPLALCMGIKKEHLYPPEEPEELDSDFLE
jgi:SecD/SecF fusion protein